MIALLQRVSRASVAVAGQEVAAIGTGLLVLVGVERGDQPETARRLAQRLLACRVFADDEGRMNRSVMDTGGALLLVPQFTLAADTTRGNRPGFERAAPHEAGRRGFDALVAAVRDSGLHVATGVFGADMDVALLNRGPVTLWLQVAPTS